MGCWFRFRGGVGGSLVWVQGRSRLVIGLGLGKG